MPVRVRLGTNAPRNSAPEGSIQHVRASLNRTAAELERVKVRCSILLREYTDTPDRDPERLALHLSARTDGLIRQAEEAIRVLEELSAAASTPSLSK